MKRYGNHDIHIGKPRCQRESFSEHISEMASGGKIAVILDLIWYVSVSGLGVVEEQSGSKCISLIRAAIHPLLLKMSLDDLIEPVCHGVEFPGPESGLGQVGKTGAAQVLFVEQELSAARNAHPWQKQICHSLQPPCHPSSHVKKKISSSFPRSSLLPAL